ncbi:Alpha/Beta hydrolase fold containing protein [Trema orientale]|uniref:Alpha/Beta hydrolase fold containing protein n=1 Tax=Trema orientale TaxID=63057 RepID=A0A2P5E8Y3_TREOI|nr:Alpha/Beta hydrolase fold containing protein [Trema orientale]
MWGLGGRYYWGRKERCGKVEGIVVMFAWMSSQERHLKSYVQLYSSLGWNSLVCHSQFLNMFFPEKATGLAIDILNVLVAELKIKPCPVVFVSFSGGPKACMFKVLQIIEGNCETQLNLDDYRLVKDCICGYIYDSSPVDFTSDLGTKFILHPTVMKMSQPPRMVSWLAHGIASSLDALFLSRFEQQRADYWQTLYSSVSMKAPYLILCSENDDLAPYQTICNFAQRLQELGGDVKVVKWNGSPHVGHYRHYRVDYEAAVTELLGKATAIYSQRIRRLEGERLGNVEATHDETIEPIHTLRKAAASSNSFQGISLVPGDDFFLPNSMEYYEGRGVGSMQDERRQEGLIHLPNPPASINAHGVLGQILFDVCVPKDVEGWDIRSSDFLNRRSFTSTRRHNPFNPIKCIRRSRL